MAARLVAIVGFFGLLISGAFGQTLVDGKGKTCTSVNKRCYELGGNQGICEPKLQSCLQTGTYPGNKNTITNLTRK
jgi:hypothetical protein